MQVKLHPSESNGLAPLTMVRFHSSDVSFVGWQRLESAEDSACAARRFGQRLRGLLICWFIFFLGASIAVRSETEVPGSEPSSGREVKGETFLAHELLRLECDGAPPEDQTNWLNYIINAAAARYGEAQPEEPEESQARRFFRSVDQTIIERGVIYPPRGQVDLLRQALTPRRPSDAEVGQAIFSPYNLRRQEWIRSLHALGDPCYYFDCDVAAVLYFSIAQKLKLPIVLVELPGHNFVRWQTATAHLNWDPNEGKVIDDQTYAARWRVTPTLHDVFHYLEPMPARRISAYWRLNYGQFKAREGNYAAALRAFRDALQVASSDAQAINETAWLLATCPDQSLRSGAEALALIQPLVNQHRRVSWLDTMAAAQAEIGEFAMAVTTEEEARRAIGTAEGALAANEISPDFEGSLKAYRSRMSYAKAVEAGLIRSTSTLIAPSD